jgi:hypothetical protein
LLSFSYRRASTVERLIAARSVCLAEDHGKIAYSALCTGPAFSCRSLCDTGEL